MPNVSYCVQEDEVHYNPYVEPFFCKLTLNDDSVIKLEGSGGLTSAMTRAYTATCVSAEIGELCTSIGSKAFYKCSDLTSVTIPNNVTSIGTSAFTDCINLTSIEMPSGITKINNHTFCRCSSLSSVTIPNNVTSIGKSALSGCFNLSSITIPDSVTSIDEQAFYYCSGLTSVTIPSGVTSIGTSVFHYCRSLISVTVEATTPPRLNTYAFYFNASDRKIYVPAESVNTYKTASGWSEYAAEIEAIPTT